MAARFSEDFPAVHTNPEKSKAKITSDTDQAVNALKGRIDSTNKDLAATQESLYAMQNSLSDCFNEVAVVRSDLERNIADAEARLKDDIRQMQQKAFGRINSVKQPAEVAQERDASETGGVAKPEPAEKKGKSAEQMDT